MTYQDTLHERDLAALSKIAWILSIRSGQREMLAEVLDALDRELGMERGTIMLLSPDGTELVVEAARNLQSPPQQEVRYQRGEGITGGVLQTGQAAIVARISEEPEFQDRIHNRRREVDVELSFLCAPIILGSEVVGTLAVDRVYDPGVSLDQELRLLNIVASMIANDVKARRLAALERQSLETENLRLRTALEERFRPENIIGNSHAMRDVYQMIHQVAPADTTVLIRGESGTGKELVASAIHYTSQRSKKPFVKVNCAALSENLLESELFGHEKGAFTGALYDRIGRIEEADGGTLFFDEIGDFSPATQVKLLRVLQEREYQRVGSNRTLKAEVRVIAATNCDLEKAVRDGLFRQDLYYRVNVFSIFLPPLRERKDDILLLVNHFVRKYSTRMNREVRRISTSATNMLLAYHWPGNVRELENCVEHAVLLSRDGVIHGNNLPPTIQLPDSTGSPLPGSLQAQTRLIERDMLTEALKRTGGKVSPAARELGITPRMMRYKLAKLGIDGHAYRHVQSQ